MVKRDMTTSGRRRALSAAVLGCSLGLTMSASACRNADPVPVAGTVTLVNRVQATVHGMTCATCPSATESALRERLEPAAIAIDPGRSVELVFQQGSSPFSSASFRSALAAGGGEAMAISIEACGSIQAVGEQAWLTSGATRLLLDGTSPTATNGDVCVTGELRDQASPPRLLLGKFGA